MLFGSLFFLTIAGSLNNSFQKPRFKVSKQDSAVNLTSGFLRFGFAGHKRLVADILWMATLLESDLSHYRGKDFNSWMFLRFFSISELDPLFEGNYVFGGRYLSIIKDDVAGANKLLEKGLGFYPKNRSLVEMKAFNHTFELGDYQEGLRLYERLADLPNPPKYLPSLLAKLKRQQGLELTETIKTLSGLLEGIEDKESPLAKKLRRDIETLTIEKDLECLNKRKGHCSRIDPYGTPYRIDNGNFLPPESYSPYRIHKK